MAEIKNYTTELLRHFYFKWVTRAAIRLRPGLPSRSAFHRQLGTLCKSLRQMMSAGGAQMECKDLKYLLTELICNELLCNFYLIRKENHELPTTCQQP